MAEKPTALPSFANLPWWELLKDSTLQELINVALTENKDLKRAVSAIEEFEARLAAARTSFIPQVEGSSRFPALGCLGGFRADGFPSDFSYSVLGNLSWELDVWGRIRRSTEASLADLLAQEENRRAVVLALVSGVARAYFDLLQFDMQLDIAKRTLESWEESVRIASARLRGGDCL